MKNTVSSFVETHNLINKENIVSFCEMVIKETVRESDLVSVNVRVSFAFGKANGCVKITKSMEGQTVKAVIYARPFLRYSKTHSAEMTYFWLFTTILHEIEHFRLANDLMEESPITYRRFFAALHQSIIFKRFRKAVVARRILRIFDPEGKKRRRMIAQEELLCTKEAIGRALTGFDQILNEENRLNIECLLKSASFLCENLEIEYYYGGFPINQFTRYFAEVCRLVKQNPRMIQKWKQLSRMFDQDGRIFSIRKIVELSKENDSNFYSEFLVRFFAAADVGWQTLFEEDLETKVYLERLANEYCRKCIDYLKNIELGKLLLNEQILQDNAAMMIKNAERLSERMQRYEMKKIGGSIVPLYRV